VGRSEEVGEACAFLSSPSASFINGVVLPVDGGWSIAKFMPEPND
jgi:meso-butanediol dehydrogenase/(S,S)-butanediol dehydrogenase/diacetyl reductase